MKSKRRHELQTNELADTLGQWIERVRPHMTMIGLLVVGVVAILAAWYYVAYSRESERAQAWRSYMDAGSDPQSDPVSELSAVADRYADTVAGLWAAQTAADLESAQGVRLLFQDRAKAETSLNAAESTYRDILDHKQIADSPMLQRRANLGLAETLEALGQLEEAGTYYQAVIDAENDSAVGKAAQQRLARLEMASTRSWYNWFSRQKPVPRKMEGEGLGGLGAGLPGGDLGTLPEAPDSDFMRDLPIGGTEEAVKPEADEEEANAAAPGDAALPEDATTPPKPEATAPRMPDDAADEPPKTDAPPIEPPKTDAPPIDAPKTDAPPIEPPAVPEKNDGAGQ